MMAGVEHCLWTEQNPWTKFIDLEKSGSSRLCVIIFAYGIVKCLSGKTFSAIWRNKLSV
ncbi:hypothetical protein VL20_3419 [Microcystis panniformis FACHB-1757]|uniref:Uncharacterized protein n=1 Tax=Microcystis panniformis FACHB-1757 TaxID=1638788 RepID=A0A0K1S373_9CHRO|nr:hypothetical protein VL20_3419 [Microcystis panniformis FACHB-1757]